MFSAPTTYVVHSATDVQNVVSIERTIAETEKVLLKAAAILCKKKSKNKAL